MYYTCIIIFTISIFAIKLSHLGKGIIIELFSPKYSYFNCVKFAWLKLVLEKIYKYYIYVRNYRPCKIFEENPDDFLPFTTFT